jgi:hypothetical protein
LTRRLAMAHVGSIDDVAFCDTGTLFSWNDDDRCWVYERLVAVVQVEWGAEPAFVCSHCGGIVPAAVVKTEEPCPGCGSRDPVTRGAMGSAVAVAHAVLPTQARWFDPPERLAIGYRRYGLAGAWGAWDMVLYLQVKQVLRRRLAQPMSPPIVSFGDMESIPLIMAVEFECDVVMDTHGAEVGEDEDA